MANKKISELVSITGANTASDDEFVIVDSSANETKKITRAELTNALEVGFDQLQSDLSTNGNDILFGDNDKAIFGAGSDLQIFHDGSNSRIAEAGTGDLKIGTSGGAVRITANGVTDDMIVANQGGSVTLAHSGTTKLTTTTTGVDVTGTAVTDGLESTCAAGDANQALLAYHPTSTSARTIAKFQSNVGSTQQDKVVIKCDGDVGIGTSSPSYKISILEDANNFIQFSRSIDNVVGSIIGRSGGANLRIQQSENASTEFWTNNTERMRLDNSGNLGIGNSDPQHKFHITHSGTGAIPTDYQMGATSPNDNYQGIHNNNNSATFSGLALETRTSGASRWLIANEWKSTYLGDLVFRNRNGATTSQESMRITSSGNLGIGHSTPQFGLTMAQGSGDAARIGWEDGSDNKRASIICSSTGDALQFHTGTSDTERMRIASNGNVGIGSTSTVFSLDVRGNVAANYLAYFKNDGNNSNRYGVLIAAGADSGSGTLMGFTDGDGTGVGGITFSGGTVTYGAFTAQHPCIIPDADNDPDSDSPAYPYGTLLETTSLSYTPKSDGTDSERGIRYHVRKTQTANSKAVLGAYGCSMNGGPENQTNEHQALVLGDGHILCNNSGGNIEMGDGICSSAVVGIGQKATASPSMIIGIAQEAVTFSSDTETKLVAVQYGLQQFTPW